MSKEQGVPSHGNIGTTYAQIVQVMQDGATWEEHLVTAPMCIAFLGQLMAISTNADFSLDEHMPEGGFLPITNPKSFRACLQQVANEGYQAFNLAHKNMDKISILSGNVPENMVNAMTLISKGSMEDIKEVLPLELRAIKKASDKCGSLAKAVEKKFFDVVLLVGKLLEVSLVAQGEYAKADELRKNIEDKKKRLEEDEEQKQEWVEDTKTSLDKAEESYYKVMNDWPSGWKKIGMQIFEGLTYFPAKRRQKREERARELAESIRASHEQARKERQEISDEIQNAIEKLGELKISEIDFKQTVDILLKGMKKLNTLQETWKDMVLFFQAASNLISTNINVKVEGIINHGNKAVEFSKLDKRLSTPTKKIIAGYTSTGAKLCWLAHMISMSYLHVSKKYLLNKITGLGNIMLLTDAEEIRTEQKKLTEESKESKETIRKEVEMRKMTFDGQIKTYLDSLEAIMDKAQ